VTRVKYVICASLTSGFMSSLGRTGGLHDSAFSLYFPKALNTIHHPQHAWSSVLFITEVVEGKLYSCTSTHTNGCARP